MNVIDLASRRRGEPEGGDPPEVCPCGSCWFVLRDDHPGFPAHGAVALRANGSIAAYAGVPHCAECGRVWAGR